MSDEHQGTDANAKANPEAFQPGFEPTGDSDPEYLPEDQQASVWDEVER